MSAASSMARRCPSVNQLGTEMTTSLTPLPPSSLEAVSRNLPRYMPINCVAE